MKSTGGTTTGVLYVYATIRRPSARRELSAFHAREKKAREVGASSYVTQLTPPARVVVVGALSTRFSPRGVSSRAFAVDST